MIASQTQSLSFTEFLKWYPEDGKRYELIEGVVVEMLTTGSREDVSGFLIAELNFEIRQRNLPYSIPKSDFLKSNIFPKLQLTANEIFQAAT